MDDSTKIEPENVEAEKWKMAFILCKQQRDAALSRLHDLQIDLSIAEARLKG